ncbi:phospholipase A1 family protein, partial [Vibrio parahaemolyticus V-223/04]
LQVGSRLVAQLGWVSVLSMNQMAKDKSYRAVGTAFIPT